MFTLKAYQQRALDTLRAYFRECARSGDADLAYYKITREVFGEGLKYHPVAELPGLPYVCVRIPTGGGKTVVACHTLGLAAKELLHAERCLALWLVPSNAIRDQTLKALKDRRHPYRLALDAAFGSVAVMDASDALYLQRPTLDTETVVVVSTLQAFRVDDTEGRKVYEPSGSLMGHFNGLPGEVVQMLRRYDDGAVIPSLENVLRARRPVVIVDEAHNARTDLSFVTLARFNPSCIVEFTATPDVEHNPSNVLHSVSALELQSEDMIKLPIRLETRPDWKELLADAVAMLSQLDQAARLEQQETGEYLRPIMLLQAQPRRKDQPTLTVDVVKECLLKDHNILPNEVAVATGSEWELEDDLLTPKSRVRFVITVQALREGWDCPFAYVLCSVAEVRSTTAVEQILGRVMRLPGAQRKRRGELNLAYAFVASANFAEAAGALQDALVDNGFERQQAADLITQMSAPIETLPLFSRQTIDIPLREAPNLIYLPPTLKGRILYDAPAQRLTYTGVMSDQDRAALLESVATPAAKSAIEQAYRRSQGWSIVDASAPAERGEIFSIPILSIQQGELFEPFEDTHFLEQEWSLADKDASLSEAEFASQRLPGQAGEIAIDERGKVVTHFIADLQQQMTLIASEQWNVGQLLNWLERNIPHPDIEPDEVARFLQRMLRGLLDGRGLSLDYLIHNKYKLRGAAEAKIDQYRKEAHRQAYQRLLLRDCPTPLVVRDDVRFAFDPNRMPPYQVPYRGGYPFPKHYYKQLGDLKPQGEEFECAQFIDTLPEVKYWVRNPVRTDQAFSLQTSTDRFYPDFVCQLVDGRTLVVEYKNVTDWSNDENKEKRDLGELWAARSGGKCLFSMPRGKDFEAIRQLARRG